MRNSFSIEMKSKQYVKSISISDEAHDQVLFEGDLGDEVSVCLVDDGVLEFNGTNGVLRIGITETDLKKILHTSDKMYTQKTRLV